MAQVTFRAATPRDDTLVVQHFTNMMLAMKIPTKDYAPDKYSTDNPALHALLLLCSCQWAALVM